MIPSYRSIVKGAGLFGASKAVNILAALVRTKCAAWMIGTVGVGMNSLFYTVQMFSTQLMGLGLSIGSVKQLSDAYASGDVEYIARHVKHVRLLGLLCGGAAIFLLSLLAPLLSQLYFGTWHYVPHFMLLGIGVAALILCDVEQSVMRSLQHTSQLALSMLLSALSTLVCTIPFYWYWGVEGVIFAIVSCAVVSAVIFLWQGHRTHAYRLGFTRNSLNRDFWQSSLPMVRSGLAFVATGLFLQGSELILQTVLATTASLAVVGLFKVGYQCAVTYPGMVFSGVVNDYFPRLSTLPVDDREGRQVVVERQIRVMFLISLPVALLLFALAPWVIRLLLSKEFLDLVPMVRWAAFSLLCKAIYLPLGYIPLALDRRAHFMLLEGLSCLVRILVVLIGYQLNGLEGIGQGVLAGSIIDLAGYLLFCRHYYGLSIRRLL